MGIKKILEIEIDPDGSFARFKAMYDEFGASLDDMPEQWLAAGDAATEAAGSFHGVTEAIEAQTEMLRQFIALQDSSNERGEKAAKHWAGMDKAAKSLQKNVLSITTSMLKWGSIGGIVGTGAGLFGLDRLAEIVGSGRRSSQGLGIGYGDRQAFQTQTDRLVDAGGFLGGVNESLTDYSKRSALYGAGVSEQQIQGKDTGEVAEETLKALKRLADATPTAGLAQAIQSRGIGGLVTVEDLRRLQSTSGEEFASIIEKLDEARRQNKVDDPTARAWQDMGVELEGAWTKIENSFVRGLVGVAEPIAHLSDVVSDSIKDFMDSGKFKEDIDYAGDEIKTFAGYLKSDEFKNDADEFFAALKVLVGSVEWVADRLGEMTGQKVSKARQEDINYAKWATGEADTEAERKGTAKPETKGTIASAIDWLFDRNQQSDSLANQARIIDTIPEQTLSLPPVPGFSGLAATPVAESKAAYAGTIPAVPPVPQAAAAPSARIQAAQIGSEPAATQGYGSRGERNNNPLNLSYAGQPGASREEGSGRFAHFDTMEQGIAAETRQLWRYAARGADTISSIVGKWAPAGENNTSAYIQRVSKQTGFEANQKLDLHDPAVAQALIKAMAAVETGHQIDSGVIRRGYDMADGGQVSSRRSAEDMAYIAKMAAVKNGESSGQPAGSSGAPTQTAAAAPSGGINSTPPRTSVQINNATGGNVTTSVAQLPA